MSAGEAGAALRAAAATLCTVLLPLAAGFAGATAILRRPQPAALPDHPPDPVPAPSFPTADALRPAQSGHDGVRLKSHRNSVVLLSEGLPEEEFAQLQRQCRALRSSLVDEPQGYAVGRLGLNLDPTSDIVKTVTDQKGHLLRRLREALGEDRLQYTGFPVELRVYEVSGSMMWHRDQVLHWPRQYEVVYTIDNDSDQMTEFVDRDGVIRRMWTPPNSVLMLQAEGAPHRVAASTRGERMIIKLVLALSPDPKRTADYESGFTAWQFSPWTKMKKRQQHQRQHEQQQQHQEGGAHATLQPESALLDDAEFDDAEGTAWPRGPAAVAQQAQWESGAGPQALQDWGPYEAVQWPPQEPWPTLTAGAWGRGVGGWDEDWERGGGDWQGGGGGGGDPDWWQQPVYAADFRAHGNRGKLWSAADASAAAAAAKSGGPVPPAPSEERWRRMEWYLDNDDSPPRPPQQPLGGGSRLRGR
eukprot:TRINITY_DN11900_c0_g1_i1.p1 TRINITY_DN11900_c0_g1~~TRINITY_DN11900_c0_g1_i1.p1  ORF type:complete len:472 (+),score=115.49 TRINITY_DN11900_c0_g1_i1:89-1504(+)